MSNILHSLRSEEHSAEGPHRSTENFTRAIVILVLLGAALRIWAFGGGRSLWGDEAMIALNIIRLPLTELFGPLEYNQFAPLGWIVIEKASFESIPGFEYALRFPALLFGIGALFAFSFLVKTMLQPSEALLAIAIFAISSSLIYYSAEAKPYILDAFFSAAILALAHRALVRPAERTKLTFWLALLGAICTLLTFGALLVLASTGLVLFGAALAQRDRPWIIALILTGLLWSCAFGILYVMHYGHYSEMIGEGNFANYWSEAFAPAPITTSGIVWYAKATHMLLNLVHNGLSNFLLVTGLSALFTGGLLIAGLYAFSRGRIWDVLLLSLPVLFALVVSAMEAYPMMGRFHLALAPPIIVLVAHGAGVVAAKFPRDRVALLALAALLLVTPAAVTISEATRGSPWSVEEIEPNLAHIAQNARPSDLVMVPESSMPAFLLYASQDQNLLRVKFLKISNRKRTTECRKLRNSSELSFSRIWFLIAHVAAKETKDNEELLSIISMQATVKQLASGTGTKFYEISGREFSKVPASVLCSRSTDSSSFEKDIIYKAKLVPVSLTACGECGSL